MWHRAHCHASVPIGQRETGCVMVKNSSCPRRDRMAGGAGRRRRRESSRDVIRNVAANRRGALESRRVAAVAIGGIQRVIVAHMAGRARRRGRRHVRASQREASRAVIEDGCCPTGCVVARGTIRRGKCGSGRRVHRIVRLLPGGQVALRISAIGGRNRQIVIVVDVARSAGHVGMSSGQQEIPSCCDRKSLWSS